MTARDTAVNPLNTCSWNYRLPLRQGSPRRWTSHNGAQTQVREQEAITTCGMLYPTNSFPSGRRRHRFRHRQVPAQAAHALGLLGGVHPGAMGAAAGDFPSGVWDWSNPGIEQQALLGTCVFFE